MRHSRWEISLDKHNFSDIQLDSDLTAMMLAEGDVELKLRKCGVTANNVTYALLGNSFGPWQRDAGYWDFFSRAQPRGILPVWGIAEVVESRCSGIDVGMRVYGFFPLTSHLRVTPTKVTERGFVDGANSRSDLPGVYNQYEFIHQIFGFADQDENYWPIFRPLIATAYMLTDQFIENNFYGAEKIYVGSASSKTACTFAACMRFSENAPTLVGLTSSANQSFVESTGLYASVISYDDIKQISESEMGAFVDMAGNGDVTQRLHSQLKNNLVYSVIVGKSHWNTALPSQDMPGPRVDAFFAPARIAKRLKDWGPKEMAIRLNDQWQNFLLIAREHFDLSLHQGEAGAMNALQSAVAGDIDPSQGIVVTFNDA